MGESEGGGTCEGDVLVDKEERGDGDAGGGLDFGDNGADAVAEGGGLVELCSEGLELCVHDGRRQGVGNGGGVWRGGGAEAAQGEEEGETAGREQAGGRYWKRGRGEDGGGAEAERSGRGGGCCGFGSHCGVGRGLPACGRCVLMRHSSVSSTACMQDRIFGGRGGKHVSWCILSVCAFRLTTNRITCGGGER
jgi:hypothetical protein